MLAKLGRGFNDIVVRREKVGPKTRHLMQLANLPILTDVEIGYPVDDLEIYPFPVPDLFANAPIVIATNFKKSKDNPKKATVKGYEASGSEIKIPVNIRATPNIPVDKIFAKERLDLLTAQAWLLEDEKSEELVVQESIAHCIPSQYTSIVAFETRQEALKERNLADDGDDNEKYDSSKTRVKSTRWALVNEINLFSIFILFCFVLFCFVLEGTTDSLYLALYTVAALAIGGTIITVASSLASFGDIKSSLENLPVLGSELAMLFIYVLYFTLHISIMSVKLKVVISNVIVMMTNVRFYKVTVKT
ncbi:hypothetical protein RFI_13832 [Reticulomyxa filosa]|uniref:Uncharacterized protein n=1 Tax=Reticulomyxa filosa TaxID=46433 RepID=X6NDF1_RETFI|nr:hypothetical protein RFI_13832 [Reticulomyxa filosa]|eukprot:ETO23352.1 hypothetical protein RFI_13832 [Reticulomyxa filosa]